MNEQPIDDGGPAFPGTRGAEGYALVVTSGMTLRDYFAAKAMAGLLPTAMTYSDQLERTGNGERALDEFMAAMAYRYADAMLKAREA